MRKIESEMNAAIKSKINFSKANTSVSYDADNNESNVYLHGNHIASLDTATNALTIKDGGWQSVTTKSRLNALLDEFSKGTGVIQRNFEWFLTYKHLKEDFVNGMEVAL